MARLLASSIALTSLLLSAPLAGQTSSVSGAPRELSRQVVAELFRDMASSLRNLVVAQESYFSDHNTYGKVLSLQEDGNVTIQPAAGVTLTLTCATANSWAGRATHDWMRGLSCVIHVGQVPPSRQLKTAGEGLEPKEEGVAVCDKH